MKKLFIVSTKPDGGKGGGIPSALVGYIDGLTKQNIDFEVIESHHEDKNILFSWFGALIKVFLLSIRYRKTATFWFHCGPWLSLLRKFTLAIFPVLLGAKTVAHIHSPTFSNYLGKNRLTRILTLIALLPFNKVVVLTPWWKDLLKRHNVKKDIYVSPNPCNQKYCDIAVKKLDTQNIKKIDDEGCQLLTMARLIPGKGVEHVIGAMQYLPESYHLTIAGDGPMKEELKAQVRSLRLEEKIEFTGWVDGIEKQNLLAGSNIFVLPSNYDSFGVAFIEAMAFNKPVIANNWGPIGDVVTPDVGVCCENPSDKELAKEIKNVAAKLEQYLGHGPKKVLSQYTPEVAANNIVKLLV